MNPEEEDKEMPPSQLSELDRMRAENLHLKLYNTELRKRATIRELQAIEQLYQELTQEAAQLQTQLAKEYKINFRTHELQAGTGLIVPREIIGPPRGE